MPLPLLSGSTVLLTDENSLPNCSLNHSPITCPLMASASLDLSFGSFTTWKPASSWFSCARLLLSARPLRGYAVYVRPCVGLPKLCSPCRMCVAAIAGCHHTIRQVYPRLAPLPCPRACPKARCGLPVLGRALSSA
jgi:hypothetical protein